MRRVKYKLVGREVVPTDDLMDWANWIETSWPQTGRIALSEIGPWYVSTVFLDGLDRRFHGDGPPLLFETAVFLRKRSLFGRLGPTAAFNNYQDRFSTWDEAVGGHEDACTLAALFVDRLLRWLPPAYKLRIDYDGNGRRHLSRLLRSPRLQRSVRVHPRADRKTLRPIRRCYSRWRLGASG